MTSKRFARQSLTRLFAAVLAVGVGMPLALAQTAPGSTPSGPPIKIGFSMALTGSLAVNGK